MRSGEGDGFTRYASDGGGNHKGAQFDAIRTVAECGGPQQRHALHLNSARSHAA